MNQLAAVRLVNKDGDVIWSTTQESQGAKFHRASTDVADRIAKKLVEDYDRAKKLKPLAEIQPQILTLRFWTKREPVANRGDSLRAQVLMA